MAAFPSFFWGRYQPLLIQTNSVIMESNITFSTAASIRISVCEVVRILRSHERPPQTAELRASSSTNNATMSSTEIGAALHTPR
jgi:hypothetical protein